MYNTQTAYVNYKLIWFGRGALISPYYGTILASCTWMSSVIPFEEWRGVLIFVCALQVVDEWYIDYNITNHD